MEQRSHHSVTAARDAPDTIAFARLMEARRQSQRGTDGLGVPEAGRNIDGAGVDQRDHWTDTGNSHQPSASGVIRYNRQQLTMQDHERLTELFPNCQQWRHNAGQVRHVFDQLADTYLEASGADDTDLEPKIAQHPPNVILNGDGLFLHQLAGRQQRPSLLAGQGLRVNGTKQIDPHHLRANVLADNCAVCPGAEG